MELALIDSDSMDDTIIVKNMEVHEDQAGLSLDSFLQLYFPQLGVRGRKRLWLNYRVCVNARVKKRSYILTKGDTVSLHPLSSTEEKLDPFVAVQALSTNEVNITPVGHLSHEYQAAATYPAPIQLRQKAYIAKQQGSFFLLYKPHNMHTVRIAAKPGISLQYLLEQNTLFEQTGMPCSQGTRQLPPEAYLLNRLDYPTAGLVLGSTHPEDKESFMEQEEQGEILKEYYLLVYGKTEKYFSVPYVLDMHKRKKTSVLRERIADKNRWTICETLHHINGLDLIKKLLYAQQALFGMHSCFSSYPQIHLNNFISNLRIEDFFGSYEFLTCSLLKARIQKGARHQIRAHLHAVGHPLIGDDLYFDEQTVVANNNLTKLLGELDTAFLSYLKKQNVDRSFSATASVLPLFLHHAHFRSPQICYSVTPTWLL